MHARVQVLGVGALGRSGGEWEFIDPATPRAGVRATHRAPRAAGEPASCGVDEYGNAQGVTLTVDVVCDAATRFEVLPPLLGAPPCHHALRLRTPKACFSFTCTWTVGRVRGQRHRRRRRRARAHRRVLRTEYDRGARRVLSGGTTR